MVQKTKDHLDLISHGPAETVKLGRRLGRIAEPGDIVLLVGNLGTGKTCLARGIARGLGINEYTPSPSFVLIREFYGRLPLYHIDLYRLDHIEEIADLGLDDYLYGNGICVIEWAEKGLGLLPPEHLLVELSHLGVNQRRLKLTPCGLRYRKMAAQLVGVGSP